MQIFRMGNVNTCFHFYLWLYLWTNSIDSGAGNKEWK